MLIRRRFLIYAQHHAQQYLGLSTVTMGKPKVVFVLGGPGAGKGTQCTRIVKVM